MKKWEYTECSINGLAMLGKEGWEAYAIYFYGGTTFYLKRELL